MFRSLLKALASLTAILSLSGCCCLCVHDCYSSAPRKLARTIVTVIPAREDGHIGTVVVNPGPKQILLNTAYSSVRVEQDRDAVAFVSTPKAVEAVFTQTRLAQPEPAVSFTTYFILGTDDLSPESEPVLQQVLAESRRRGSSEITVIGHTDRVGSEEKNDGLSLQRAERIREQLIRLGIQEDIIFATSRGEREPITETADEVPEPSNRRVEISVR